MSNFIRRFLRLAPAFALAVLLLSHARPVAAEELHCFTDLNACFGRAGQIDSWWDRWLAGLDCEVNFFACLERAAIAK